MTGPAPPVRVSLTYPVDALVSYHYYGEDRHMAPLATSGRLRLIGDSGAYSAWSVDAKIDLAEYAAWCRRWWDHLCWCASLDVIGDPAGSWRNWAALRDRHQLLTVPTLHAGADVAWLDAYAAEGVDLVGLGGMAGTGQAPRAFRWVVHMMAYARRRWPAVRFHLWGVTSRQFLEALPVWSADSSGVLGQGYRFGTLRVFDPARGRHTAVTIRRGTGSRDMYKHGELLRRVYGVNPAEVETSHPGNRTTLIQLAAASTQQYASWLQRRHRVAAPSMFRPGQGDLDRVVNGPRVHLVSGRDDLDDLVGPRLHVALATAGRAQGDEEALATAGRAQGDEEAPVEAGDGPRVHVVAGTQQAPGRNDLDDLVGPRLHVLDGAMNNMRAVTGASEEEQDGG